MRSLACKAGLESRRLTQRPPGFNVRRVEDQPIGELWLSKRLGERPNGIQPPLLGPFRPHDQLEKEKCLNPSSKYQIHETKDELSDTVSTPVMTDHSFEPHSLHVAEGRPRSYVCRRGSIHHIQHGAIPIIMGHLSPFCEEIMFAPKNPKVKALRMDAYDGTIDPYMHLVSYRYHMYVQGINEAT